MSEDGAKRGGDLAQAASRRSAVPPVFLSILLAWLAGFLAITLEPGYRGGSFITVVLAGTVLALAVVLVSEIADRRGGGRTRAARVGPPRPLSQTEATLDGGRLARAAWFSVLLVGAVVVLGIYVGTPLALLWIGRRHCRAGWGFAAGFALVIGTLLPFVFAQVVSIELWPGAIPAIIPGWLGGGLLPPV